MVEININKRTRWAIEYVCRMHRLTNETLAPFMGVHRGTVSNYRTMRTTPRADFIKHLCEQFDINEKWLTGGKGEPFPGARQKYPDICGPEEYVPQEPKVVAVNEGISAYNEINTIKISEDLTLAAAVLESDTPYAVALHLNIRSFARAVDADTQLSKIELRIDNLENKVNDLTDENRLLRERLDKVGQPAGSGPRGGAGDSKVNTSNG